MNMKSLLFACLISASYLTTGFASIPGVLFKDSIKWSDMEFKLSDNQKMVEISKIRDEILYYFEDNKNLSENLDNFRFIDFDNDGYIDILYTGYAGSESKSILLFRNYDNVYYSPIFKGSGILVDLVTFFGHLTGLKILEIPCCDEKIYKLKLFNVINTGRDIGFQLLYEYRFLKGTQFPEDFNVNISFITKNEEYFLRSKPVIDNANIIANYKSGSIGKALATKEDETGRVWYFAIMINNIEPHMSLIYEKMSFSFGWISSRYVTTTSTLY